MVDQRPEITDPSYQDKDIHIPIVTGIVVIALVVTALTFVGIRKMFVAYDSQFQQAQAEALSPVFGERELPPAPRLQVNEPVDLAAHRAEEDQKLQGYKWVDPAAGIVQIPIDRAIELVAERGLPFGTPAVVPPAETVAAQPAQPVEAAQPEATPAETTDPEAAADAVESTVTDAVEPVPADAAPQPAAPQPAAPQPAAEGGE